MRRLLPCVVLLFARPASPAQQHDDRSPTFPKFESSAHVSDKCMACARILDCLKEGLLPRLRQRFENPEGTMLGAPVRHAELAAPPKKPPKDEV